MARLILSAGMLAARADSMAAFKRRLPLGSPPPLRAATVISRRILEKSLPRCTSVFPFFLLICDHRECPDMAYLPSSVTIVFGPPRPADGSLRAAPASAHRRCSSGVSGVNRGHGVGRSFAPGSGPRWTKLRYAVHACRISPVHGTSLSTFTPTSREDVPT